MLSLAKVRDDSSRDASSSFSLSSGIAAGIAILGLLMIFVSTIWYDFISFYFDFEFNRSALFAAGILFCGAATLYRLFYVPAAALQTYRIPLAVLIYFSLTLAGHVLAGEQFGQNVTFLVAPLAALSMLAVERRILVAFLALTVAICTAMQAIEFLTCSYFFVFDDGTYRLDELAYSGSVHSFRAKGIFSSPLTANYMAILAILLSRLSIGMTMISSLSAIVAISKGAMVSNAALLVLRAFDPKHRTRSALIAGLVVLGFVGVAQLTRTIACIWPAATLGTSAHKRYILHYQTPGPGTPAEPGSPSSVSADTAAEANSQPPASADTTAKPGSQPPASADTAAKPGSHAPASADTAAKPGSQAPASADTAAKPGSQAPASADTAAKPGSQAPAFAGTAAKPGSQAPASADTAAKPSSRPPIPKQDSASLLKRPMSPYEEPATIPRDVARNMLVERMQDQKFNILKFLGTSVDPSASTTSFRLFVWTQNLRYFFNFDAFHMLFGWPHFAYQIDIQGTESSVIKELEDYGLVGFVFALFIKFFAARNLWKVSRLAAVAAIGYYVLAIVQPIFTTLGTCALFWLLVLTAACSPELLRPQEDWSARIGSFFTRIRGSRGSSFGAA